ncbi:VOC family protein [Streptomyces sp. NPDC051320]|uniref:VOC family protein n=1 Tax=Streptomyces sp. NPDC051320 TaxID=3154644 RepID=UPI0034341C8C
MTVHAAAGVKSSGEVFGAPCWVSLTARDLDRARDFYRAVLGWEYRPTGLGDEFTVAVSGGVPVASIGTVAPSMQRSVAWTSYFAVEDADRTVSRIRERSGTVAVGPLSLSVGRGALAADRDGAAFGIWEGQLPTDWALWRRRTPAWLGLRTRDAFDAAIFYGEVLDWASDRPGSCQVDFEGGEVVLRSEGHTLARLSSGAEGAASDPDLRPRWDVHFPVADVAATARAAERNGGSVLPRPHADGTDATEATLRDPDGARFTVTTRPSPE